jgi:hypothetical protein
MMKKKSPMKNKVVKHLKGDVKSFKHEVAEDRELIKKLEGKKMKKKAAAQHKKHEAKESKAQERKEDKAEKKLKKEVKAGKKELKVEKVMKEYKKGKLHSGSKKGPVVTNPKQAIAISLSEARRAVKRKKKK